MTTTQRLRVHTFTISVDGYGAGPDQDLDHPLGIGGEALHNWAFETATFRGVHDLDGGDTGVDERYAALMRTGIGATIMGRNMFGPVRGDWPDESWTGWWGENPPYHHDVFVLTHHPRRSFEMAGGTTFHFVTDGLEAAAERARAAAGGQDVLVSGGAATIGGYLKAGLIDEMTVAIVPMLLGGGARLFDDLGAVGYECAGLEAGEAAVHARFVRTVSA